MADRPFSVAAFRRAWADTALSNEDIAAQFGISRAQVSKRASWLQLPARAGGPKKHVSDAHVLRLHELGMAVRDISEVTGLHWQTVRNRLVRLGARSRGIGARSKLSAAAYRAALASGEDPALVVAARSEREKLLLRMVNADVARADIARVLGCHTTTISKWARKLGAKPRKQGGQRRTSLAEFREMMIAERWAAEQRRAG